MKRDFIEIFRSKLLTYGIKGKDLAAEAGRTPQNISEVLNRKVSPSIDSLNELVDAAERLHPGFADEFYLALAGRVDFATFVRSLSLGDASTMLILLSNRISDLASQRQKVAA
jgi:transcriptional regulator with XRE-family HTH domain